MANEGIMALPAGMGMPGEQTPREPITVSSADAYDASLTALRMTDPQEFEAFKQQLRTNLQGVEIPPQQLDALIGILERLVEQPQDYPEFAELAQADGIDVPPEFDPEFVGALLVVLNEMRGMVSETMQDVTTMGPAMQGMEGMEPAQFAEGGLADVAAYLQSQGRGEDKILAHITPGEAAFLQQRGGAGTINPVTGLPEYGWLSKAWKAVTGAVKSVVKGVVSTVKKVLQSPVGRILGTIALATVLGPTAIGMSLGTAGTAALASGATTLMAGGSIKDALVSGALGYVGGGGTIMGVNPVASVGGYLSGISPVGSALNTGLATGVIGAGIGKLAGMSTADALKMGLTSGATAGALKALQPGGAAPTEGGTSAAPAEGGPAALDRSIGGLRTAADATGVGAPGQIGTASDMLGGGLRAPSMAPSMSYDPMSGGFKPNYSIMPTGAPSAGGLGMEGAGSGLNFGGAPAMTGARGMGDALGRGLTAARPFGQGDLSVAAGGTGVATNYSMNPVPVTPAAPAPTGFLDKMIAGAKDLYNEYLSPSRPGLAADAGILQKYGPLALAGTAVAGAAGGFEATPATPPLYDPSEFYRESQRRAEERTRFLEEGGYGLDTYQRPQTPGSVVVPTPSYASIPIGQPGMVTPGGVTRSPGGVAQPYNVSGLYGVPLIYGQRPPGYAKGGELRPTEFPRKTGPINGPGTGTSDSIPAMLSDGEFVFTAKAVRNAGGGSRRKGAARMYKLMKKLEGGPVKAK